MSKITALFLTENGWEAAVPKEWVQYVCTQVEQEFWKHYFLWEAYQLLELLREVEIRDLRVLEPGCGNGVVGSLLSLMGAEVTLLDYSEAQLSKARKCACDLGVETKIKFIKADLFSSPFPTQYYDLVWNDGVIEHFEDPLHVVHVMAGMARPGGNVLVTVPNKWTFNTFFIRPWRRWRNAYPFDRWGWEKSFSESQLRQMLRRAGLQDVRSSTHHFRRAWLDDYLLHSLLQDDKALRAWTPSLINAFDFLEMRVPFLGKLGFIAAAIGKV